jgi:aspartate/methionine/tyrosine aminotransferase
MISDETYDQLVFRGEHYSPGRWDDEGRVISIFSVSKTYSMTGWRVGYAVASTEIIRALSKIQEPIVSCVNTVAQHAAIAALLGPQDSAREMLAHYGRRRDLAVRVAREQGLRVFEPHGAFYMLVDISEQPKNSFEFCLDLLDAKHVAVAPGCSFGSLCENYVRISLCASDAHLADGLARLAAYLRETRSARGVSAPPGSACVEPVLEAI